MIYSFELLINFWLGYLAILSATFFANFLHWEATAMHWHGQHICTWLKRVGRLPCCRFSADAGDATPLENRKIGGAAIESPVKWLAGFVLPRHHSGSWRGAFCWPEPWGRAYGAAKWIFDGFRHTECNTGDAHTRRALREKGIFKWLLKYIFSCLIDSLIKEVTSINVLYNSTLTLKQLLFRDLY